MMGGSVANFVLVHGAWGGAWVWDETAEAIRAAGHRVHALDLTGLGARGHLGGLGVNLTTHITDVTETLTAHRLSEVILVGHSYGGMVITGAADRAAERVAALVYLDAFLPRDGDSLLSLGTEHSRAWILASAQRGGGFVERLPRTDSFASEARYRAQSLGCFAEGIRLSGAYQGIRRRSYIRAIGYDPSPFAAPHAACVADPGWRTATIGTGHTTMLEDPIGTARLLLEAGG